jgi:hypothetical protein
VGGVHTRISWRKSLSGAVEPAGMARISPLPAPSDGREFVGRITLCKSAAVAPILQS